MVLYCTAVKIILKKDILDRSWMNRQSQLLKLSVISHDHTMNSLTFMHCTIYYKDLNLIICAQLYIVDGFKKNMT